MRRIHLLFIAAVLTVLPGASALAQPSTVEIATEVVRTVPRAETGVVQLWWLPVEYWMAASRELGQSPEETEAVRKAFQDYTLLAAIDVSVDASGSPTGATIAELVQRMAIYRNGDGLKVLRVVNPAIANRTPQLVYPLKASLGTLGPALRVLPLGNLSGDGKPILSGSRTGEVHVVYSPPEGGKSIEIRWHGPLTAVAGPRTCPTGGERLEAHWDFCPWHGAEAKTPAPASGN